MGFRGKRRGPNNRNNGQGDKRPKHGPPSAGGWLDEVEKNNADFEEYYREQGIVPEGEWDQFLATLRKPLPVTFRINGGGRFADFLRDKLESDFFSHFTNGDIMVEDDIQPPRPLPWYPNKYAWHMEFTRQQLRKQPLLNEIHEFMKKANDAGSISRQEAVSMVPPLFLDVQPHHAVLDMCAAPGSKTQQLLEALHAGEGFPSGFVVANDADFKRCSLLTHQTKRVCSPCLLVTNHSAEQFPEIKYPAPAPAAGADAAAEGAGKVLRFDRILADVPCSGDGTMRKAPDIWRRWGVAGGNGLHLMQLRIALQGCKLLKVGGRMVYSTCTFNPIEDEAVVAELLLLCGGAMELVDVSDELPSLRRMPGMTSWKVRDKFRWYNSWDEAKDVCYKLDPSMFPTPAKSALPLQRCMRFLPHHQDTGGFFVCVLRKTAELPEFELPTARDRLNAGPGRAMSEEPGADDGEDGEADEAGEGPQGEGEGEQEEGTGRAAAGEAEGEGAGPSGRAKEGRAAGGGPERVPPIEIAKSAAQQALEAAERAVAAYEAKDLDAAGTAAQDASRAAARAGYALDVHNRILRAQARHAGKAGADGSAAPAVAPASGAQEATPEAAAGSGEDASKAEEAAAEAGSAPAPSTAPASEEAAGAGAGPGSAAAAAEAEAGAEAAGAPGSVFKPSWIRGGGGRKRDALGTAAGPGGRPHAYLDPVVPVEDPELLAPLVDYYGLSKEFPLWTHLIARSVETARPKRLYFICDAVRELLVADEREQLKVTSTGLKVFERQDIKDSSDSCQYRLAQEGLPFMLQYVTRQRVQLTKDDFLALLTQRALMMPDAQVVLRAEGEGAAGAAAEPSPAAAGAGAEGAGAEGDAGKPRDLRPVIKDNELLAQVEKSRFGCVVAELKAADAEALGFTVGAAGVGGETGGGALTAAAPLALSAWKGKASLAIMVDRNECAQMMDRIAGSAAAMSKKQ